jgi:hypothetical protein
LGWQGGGATPDLTNLGTIESSSMMRVPKILTTSFPEILATCR